MLESLLKKSEAINEKIDGMFEKTYQKLPISTWIVTGIIYSGFFYLSYTSFV